MAADYSIEALIRAVRRRMFIAATDDGVTFPTDADLIDLANQEMVSFLAPWIIQAREGHFITSTITPTVALQASYTIPSRALGDNVSTVNLVDASGNAVFPGLVEADLELATLYPASGAVYGQPLKYYFQSNSITLVPAPADNTYSFQIFYPQRPNQFVATTSVGVITAVTQVGGNYQIAYSGSPGGFTASAVYEVVHRTPGFEIVAVGTANGSGSGYIQFSGTLPGTISVGDSLCLADTSNYPTNVPADIYLGLFADWLALRAVELRGDSGSMERMETVFKRTEKLTRGAYLGKRERLGHRKVVSSNNRRFGRWPLYRAK